MSQNLHCFDVERNVFLKKMRILFTLKKIPFKLKKGMFKKELESTYIAFHPEIPIPST